MIHAPPSPDPCPRAQATPEQVLGAPKASQGGPFGAFTVGGGEGGLWVAMPQWRALALARHPVALYINDCSRVPSIVSSTKTKV